MRAYLRYKRKIRLTEHHKHRENLVKTVQSKLSDVDDVVWDTLDYYYQEVRCELYHESAGKTITDESFYDYKESVEFVIDRMFDIRSEPLVRAQCTQASVAAPTPDQTTEDFAVQLQDLDDPVDKVIVAVAALTPRKFDEVNEFFRKAGDTARLDAATFTNILARNSGSKKYFYHNKELKVWQLSGLGDYRLRELRLGSDDE